MSCHTNLHVNNTTIGQSGFVPQPGLKKDRRDGAVKSHHAVIQQQLPHCNTLKPTTNRYYLPRETSLIKINVNGD